MERHVASRESARNTRFVRETVDHGHGLMEKAREHASRRNTDVVVLLTYAGVLKSRNGSLRPELLHEHPARWQNLSARQTPAPEGDFEIAWDPQRGYSKDEAAHCLPCSLDYNGADFSALGANAAEAAVLRGPFADVSPLPAIYNDADQRAEDAGLRRRLERAVRKILAEQKPGASVDADLIRRVYEHEWVPGARTTYETVMAELRPLWAVERLRRKRVEQNRHTGLSEADLNPDPAALFYSSMYEIVEQYDRVTASRQPIDLQAFCVRIHVSELETAGNPAAGRRWPRRLELAD
jgi:hypothetical protein